MNFEIKDKMIHAGVHEFDHVILEINENASVLDKDSISVQFVKFEYDIEKAAKAIEESILPNDYAENLRNGF